MTHRKNDVIYNKNNYFLHSADLSTSCATNEFYIEKHLSSLLIRDMQRLGFALFTINPTVIDVYLLAEYQYSDPHN